MLTFTMTISMYELRSSLLYLYCFFIRIRTRIVGLGGKQANHLTTTAALVGDCLYDLTTPPFNIYGIHIGPARQTLVNTKCQGTKKFGSLFLSFSSWTCCSCWWWWCWAQQNCSEFVLVRVLLQSKLHYDNNLFLPAANVWTELLSAPGNDQSKLNKFSKVFFLVNGLKGFPTTDVINKRSCVMLKQSNLIGCSMSHCYF